jgi:hypothetical protein
MIVVSARNKELEAEVVAIKSKYSQDRQALENRLQESMALNQKLFVESIEKNAKIEVLKRELLKRQSQEKSPLAELASESTAENSNQTEQKKTIEKKQLEPKIHNQQLLSGMSDTNFELEKASCSKSTTSLKENLKPSAAVTSSKSDNTGNESSKRSYETADLSNEPNSDDPLVKKQSTEFIDTKELSCNVNSKLSGDRHIPYSTFADAHNIVSEEELTELLHNPTPWHLLDDRKQAQYTYLNNWMLNVSRPETVGLEMKKLMKNRDGSLNTYVVVTQIRHLLKMHLVDLKYFAEKKLCIPTSHYKHLIRSHLEWSLSSDEEKNAYRCIYEWVNAGEEAWAVLKDENAAFVKEVAAKNNNQTE